MPSPGNCFGFNGMESYMGGTFMFLIPILIIALLWFVFYKNNNIKTNSLQSNDALGVLKRRFANSEISQEEYLAKKETLLA